MSERVAAARAQQRRAECGAGAGARRSGAMLGPVVVLLEQLHADLDAACFGGALGPAGISFDRATRKRRPGWFDAEAYAARTARAGAPAVGEIRLVRALLATPAALVEALLHCMAHQAAAVAGAAELAVCGYHPREFGDLLEQRHRWRPAPVGEPGVGFASVAPPARAGAAISRLTRKLARALTLQGLPPAPREGDRRPLRAFACDGCESPRRLYGRGARSGVICEGCRRPLEPVRART